MQRHLNCKSHCRCDGILSLETLGYTVCRWRSVMREREKWRDSRETDGQRQQQQRNRHRERSLHLPSASAIPYPRVSKQANPSATWHSLKKMSQMKPKKKPPKKKKKNIDLMISSNGNCSLNLRITFC